MAMVVKQIQMLVSSLLLLQLMACNSNDNMLQNSRDAKKYYPDYYDQTIDNVCSLFDSKSLNQKMFSNYKQNLNSEDEIVFIKGKQFCKFHIANGGSEGEFQVCTVGYTHGNPNFSDTLTFASQIDFITNNNVKLGIGISDFKKHYSPKIIFTEKKENDKIYLEFHDEYNSYKSNYFFHHDTLTAFSFGFSED